MQVTYLCELHSVFWDHQFVTPMSMMYSTSVLLTKVNWISFAALTSHQDPKHWALHSQEQLKNVRPSAYKIFPIIYLSLRPVANNKTQASVIRISIIHALSSTPIGRAGSPITSSWHVASPEAAKLSWLHPSYAGCLNMLTARRAEG